MIAAKLQHVIEENKESENDDSSDSLQSLRDPQPAGLSMKQNNSKQDLIMILDVPKVDPNTPGVRSVKVRGLRNSQMRSREALSVGSRQTQMSYKDAMSGSMMKEFR